MDKRGKSLRMAAILIQVIGEIASAVLIVANMYWLVRMFAHVGQNLIGTSYNMV